MGTAAAGEFTYIGKSVFIKGEISGSEDICVDGRLEGKIELASYSLTVGPNGNIHANIRVKNVSVAGTLDGNIHANERTELRKTALVSGDVQTRRIAIEEGAYFKGKLEILADAKAPASESATASGAAAGFTGGSESKK